MSLLDWLLNPSGLTPHGFCLSWSPGLVALHAGSDGVVGLAYLSIPLALASFVRQRRDLQYGWVAYLFVAFILACGATHLFSILTLWVPAYGVEGLVKLLTAILSTVTAVMLWPLIPQLVALPSTAQLRQVNTQLAATVAEQAQTSSRLLDSEARARNLAKDLERRVAERTNELTETNAKLVEALARRTEAEQALAISEEEFRASFEGAAVGKAHSDPSTGRIVRVNRAFAHMLGYEPAELVGRIGWDLTWPEDLVAETSEYSRVLAGQTEAYVREKRYIRKDGQPVWGRVSATIVRVPGGARPVLTIAVIEDIDDSHKAKTALQETTRELQEALQARDQTIVQRDLLLREVYHRVKNNLQIVDSLLVMQARQLKDPVAKDAVLGLRNRVYALGLVHHQLIGSRDLKTFDIAPFLKELSANIVEGGVARGVTLSVQAPPLDVGLDFAIPLGLLVTELVSNSLKHAFPDGRGAIEVSLKQDSDGSVVLVVSDNGKGYEEMSAPRGNKGGLGIGIIRGLVAQLKGTLTVQSDNGARSEVRIAAPVLA